MSLLLRNELELSLGHRRCQARVRKAGSFGRRQGQADCSADGDSALTDTLAALVQSGRALPRRARLVLADELVYFSTVAATMSHARAEAHARAFFHHAIGDTNLSVSCQLAPGGYTWIAAAVDGAMLADVRTALAAQGVSLAEVEVGLFRDLRMLSRAPIDACSMVALVREQGLTMVAFQGSGVVDVAWERCDILRTEELAARVQARVQRFLGQAVDGSGAALKVAVSLFTADLQRRELLAATARGLGWAVLPAAVAPAVGS